MKIEMGYIKSDEAVFRLVKRIPRANENDIRME